MEEKIVENKKEDLPSLDLFHSLLSIISLSSVYLLSLPTIYHPTLVHRQHRILCSLCLNEQYSTGQFDPNGRHQWNGTV